VGGEVKYVQRVARVRIKRNYRSKRIGESKERDGGGY
jgi:hypothetical protein